MSRACKCGQSLPAAAVHCPRCGAKARHRFRRSFGGCLAVLLVLVSMAGWVLYWHTGQRLDEAMAQRNSAEREASDLRRTPTAGALSSMVAAGDRIVIDKAAPVVETHTFDPRNPPKEMPALVPPEVAVTRSDFSITVEFAYTVVQQQSQGRQWSCTVELTSVTLHLKLASVIWLPTNVTAKTRAHQVAHERLSTIYYKTAEDKARNVAAPIVAKRHTGTGDSAKAAADKAIRDAMDAIVKGYLDTVHVPCDKAQKAFCRITDHGRNSLDEDNAIEQAVKDTGSNIATVRP